MEMTPDSLETGGVNELSVVVVVDESVRLTCGLCCVLSVLPSNGWRLWGVLVLCESGRIDGGLWPLAISIPGA